MSRFYVGQKVVCVDDSATAKYLRNGHRPKSYTLDGLVKGALYTIRDIVSHRHPDAPLLSLRVEEITRPYDTGLGCEPGYAAERFRPAVEPSTDISIFTAMLNPAKQTEPVE